MATTLPPTLPPEVARQEEAKSPFGEPPRDSSSYSPPQPAARKQQHSGIAGGVILITLGVVALFATWAPGGAAWLFVGLGTGFVLARVLTGKSGYAVPAGILLGFGTFIWLTETGAITGPASGGIFFICLGLGFIASYAIAARPQAVWPVVPGLLLIGFGAVVQATTIGTMYPQLWWLVQYWPVVLVSIGAWLLLRDRIPEQARTPVALIGTALLIVIGLAIAASTIVMVGVPYATRTQPMPMPWPMMQVPFGSPPVQDSVMLSSPADGLGSIQVTATSGSTIVRSTTATTVSVQATRHYWTSDSAPDVQLVPSGGMLLVQTSTTGASNGTYVDYVIDVPSQLGATLRSASGSISVSGLDGPVSISTASGAIDGFNLAQVTDVHSISGSIDLSGDFGAPAQIGSVSGSVNLGFTPAASVHIDAASMSGDVHAEGLALSGRSSAPHVLIADLANGGPTISIRTTSGSIRLARGA